MNEDCCTTALDDPDKDDHESVAIDKYSDTLLGGCQGSYMQGELAVTLEKDGTDGWKVDWVTILMDQGIFYTCLFNLWLDDSKGYSNYHTRNCNQGKYKLALRLCSRKQ